MTKRILVLSIGFWVSLSFSSCGTPRSQTPSGIEHRLLASQGVTAVQKSGGLVILNGQIDTLTPTAPLSAGNSPGLMAISPGRGIVAAFDSSSNTVYAVNTATEKGIGSVHISGPTISMVVPTDVAIGYAAVPSAMIDGFSFQGAVDIMNFSISTLSTIAVQQAQMVVSDATGTTLLAFSNDSNSMTVLYPNAAVPPVDTSCLTNPPNAVCVIVPGFDRPVFAVISGTTAYVLNCGPQCGGTQASVMVFDLPSLTVTNTIPVDGATWALLNDNTLYVAGTSPTNHACTGQQTAATTCGRLSMIDIRSNKVVGTAVITDGYHDRMDFTTNGQLFVGSYDCTNIGNVNSPSGEVRGCLSIYRTADNTVVIPPDNGDVLGFQNFTSRYIEYVAEGGYLRVYDTTKDVLYYSAEFLQTGTINVVGYIGDVKAIDFF